MTRWNSPQPTCFLPRNRGWSIWARPAMALLGAIFCLGSSQAVGATEPIRVLLLDGSNPYHDWRMATPLLVESLRQSGRFVVDVLTVPPDGDDRSTFHPAFHEYRVILSNYNSQEPWPDETKRAFVEFVQSGGGFVCVHAASNAFADWPDYNTICGLGGWYGRDAAWGPYVYWRDGDWVRDDAPGPCGSHGPQHEFQVVTREADHPILRGLPLEWMHAQDELYDRLRGPARNMTVLATAYSDPVQSGTGRHEPVLWVVQFGKGRIFHTTLGHAEPALRCTGFITTLLRGTEWAATGEVTLPVPEDFPTTDTSRMR